jgi:squalene-hopene/tetraprenyl-beta-curcumene cyclase
MTATILAISFLAGPQVTHAQALEAWRRGADFLLAQRGSDGTWGRQGHPSVAYTALIASALLRAPEPERTRRAAEAMRALEWITARQNGDGSFSEMMETHKTYTTGIVLHALASTEETRSRWADAIRRAQDWMRGAQMQEGIYRGGLGYGDREIKVEQGQARVVVEDVPSLSTTAFAAEGMRAAGAGAEDPFFRLVTAYVQSCQNSGETNDSEDLIARLRAAGYVIGEDGGMVYAPFPPEKNKPSPVENEDGTRTMRSYGSMTYEGLKTYLYAGLTREDPRVEAAMRWVRANYTVERHPGFEFDRTPRAGDTGLYYYYLAMARALDAYGERPLRLEDGGEADWVADLVSALLRRQRENGSWFNENPRWWEDDPVLVTAYALHALNVLVPRLED